MTEERMICYECGNAEAEKFRFVNQGQFAYCTDCNTVEPLFLELSRTGRAERVRQSAPIESRGREPVEGLIQRGSALLEARDFGKAGDVFEQASVAFPEDQRVWAGRAVAATRRWADRDDSAYLDALIFHSIAGLFASKEQMGAFELSFQAYHLACRRDRLNRELIAISIGQEDLKKTLQSKRRRNARSYACLALWIACQNSVSFMAFKLTQPSASINQIYPFLLGGGSALVFAWLITAFVRRAKTGTFKTLDVRRFQVGMQEQEARKEKVLRELERLGA